MKLLILLAPLFVLTMITEKTLTGHDAARLQPPAAKRVPKIAEIHGDTRVDEYHWLRDKTNPEVIAYLEAENAYTDAAMKPTEALRQALYKEMLGHIKQTDFSAPYPERGYLYYSRTEEGKQYSIYCRKKGGPEESRNAPEQVLLDLNEMAKGQKFMALGTFQVSDDGGRLAYSTDNTGFRQYTLHIKDLRSGELLPERIEKTTSVAWAADNKTVFYTVEDAAKRGYRLYRHQVGSAAPDELVYEEKDEMFHISIGRTRSGAYLLLHSSSHTTSEVRYLPASEPSGTWKIVTPREHDHEYDVDHQSDTFFIRTNSGGRNFRLVSAPVSDPRRQNWKEIVPHRPQVMLEGVLCFRHHYVLLEREKGLQQIRVTNVDTRASHRISFPEPTYSLSPAQNREFHTTMLRFNYQSFVTPSSVFDYQMEERTRTLLKQTEVPGGYDQTQYQLDRLYATASDGTKIPVSLVYKKGLKRDGRRPLLLSGYGSYGISTPDAFNSNRLCLLDRGMVFAIAHIRGGGEMGKAWHDQGRMMNKKNTFTDFIAAAEFLISEKFTSKDRLLIEGGSAGGLLMGVVTNLRPELFHAVVALVPFVDVVNTMLDSSLPLTVGEFEEWGNPQKKEEYDYIKTYCPYTNLEKKAYPAMLVRTSLNDSQVMYWEPAKYVAKLRALKTDSNPLLLKVNMAAGHRGASGRYDYLREQAFDYAFLLTQVGIDR